MAYSRSIRALLVLTALVNGQATQSIVPDMSLPAVDLGYVKYQGYTNATAGIDYFRGLQYAANPTGALRWQKPIAIESANNFTRNATYNAAAIPPACWASQSPATYASFDDPTNYFYTPQGFSEDCLVLDVLVPSNPSSERLPVMVQIHGGAYTEGSAQTYPGDAMANASNGGLIYVSIQYRLGVFGFLSGSEVADNGVLNAGLLDQRAALNWIQRNIGAFGGDASRVTIWGGSAGGGSVSLQMIAGGAKEQPPFSAAISEYTWWPEFYTQSQQEAQYQSVLQATNCTSISCLRALPGAALATAGQLASNTSFPSPGYGFGPSYFGPVVDGDFIQELPSQAFAQGHFQDVPLLVDRDMYEGYIFSNFSLASQADETTDAMSLFPLAGLAFFSRLYELYPASDYNSTFFQRQTWWGDWIINCPTYHIASNAVDHKSNRSAVFKMTFAQGTQVHGATAPFLASTTTDYLYANDQELAKIMTSYWLSFALTHDPNTLRAEGAPFWPSYAGGGIGTVADGESVGFETLSVTYGGIGLAQDPDAGAKCDFWNSHPYQAQH